MTKGITPYDVLKTGVLALLMALTSLASAKDLPPLPDGEDCFTLAVFGDTQAYSSGGGTVSNPSFKSRVDWLSNRANLAAQNILFVSHQGDIVDAKTNEGQWTFASEQMARLDGVVPYGISPGNHDLGDSVATTFSSYFPASRYSSSDWYGGSFSGVVVKAVSYYGDNANSYQVFSWKDESFVVFHIQCNAGRAVLDWVNDLLDGPYAGHKAIIVTHMYLGAVTEGVAGKCSEPSQRLIGRMRWKKEWAAGAVNPCETWQYCYSRHGNIILILCGDQSEALSYRQMSRGLKGNAIHEICMDYPHSDMDDWIRLYRFFPRSRKIEVYTYSPSADALCESAGYCTEERFHQFALSEEPVASVKDVLVRQQWPWNASIRVDYTLSAPAGGRFDVTPIVKNGATEVTVPGAAVSGDIDSLEAGRHVLFIDAAQLDFAGSAAELTVSLALAPASGGEDEAIYRLVSLTGDGTVIDLSRADIRSGRWGSYMDSGADYRAWLGDKYASKADVLDERGLFIWTGVTNSMAYRTDWLVLRRIPAGHDIAFTANSITARLTKDYWLGVFEYTQGQYARAHKTAYEMHYNANIPEDYDNNYYKRMHFTNVVYAAGRPVDKVSWSDVCGANGRSWPLDTYVISDARYLGQLRHATGLDFLLPTELQWEYGAKALSTTDFGTGYDWYSSDKKTVLALIGRFKENGGLVNNMDEPDQNCSAENGTAIVGSYVPNPWGIYDGQGNVKEWTMDRFESLDDMAARAAAAGGVLVDTLGSDTADSDCRVLRNGSYSGGADETKLSVRTNTGYNNGKAGFGFRVALAMNAQDVQAGLSVSPDVAVCVKPDETAVWRTSPGANFTVPCYWPASATRAELSVLSDGEALSDPVFANRIGLSCVTNLTVCLPAVVSPETERTVELVLTFLDSFGREVAAQTAKLGSVEGFCGASASVKKPTALRKRCLTRAVLPVPYGVQTLTLDGTTVETGLTGAAGWYWWGPLDEGKHSAACDELDPVWIRVGVPGALLIFR